MIEGIKIRHACKRGHETHLYNYEELVNHANTNCDRFGRIYTCPYGCISKKLTRNELKDHLQKDC